MNKDIKQMIVPKLRFPEFIDGGEWSEKSLKNLSIIIMGASPKSENYNENQEGLPLLQGNADIKNRLSAPRIYTKIITKECQINDILLSVRAPVGTVAKSKHNACIGRGIAAIHSKDNNSQEFIYQLLLSYEYNWKNISQGGTFDSVNSYEINNLKVKYPNPKEQQKIANCLSSIDDYIKAQTQKLNTLKDHKKGLMQQLFPAKGETVPKLRFPEFINDGEWKEKKLSKVAKLTSSKRIHVSDYVSTGVPFYRGKEISILRNNEVPKDLLYISNEHYNEIKNKYGVPVIGDILITAVGTLGNVYCIKNNNKFYFKDGNLIWMKKVSEVSNFVEILLEVMKNAILSSAIGSSQKALTIKGLNNLVFRFPLQKEQQKIADCLSSIDELITAQSKKIKALKAHKKGLMQNLFPLI